MASIHIPRLPVLEAAQLQVAPSALCLLSCICFCLAPNSGTDGVVCCESYLARHSLPLDLFLYLLSIESAIQTVAYVASTTSQATACKLQLCWATAIASSTQHCGSSLYETACKPYLWSACVLQGIISCDTCIHPNTAWNSVLPSLQKAAEPDSEIQLPASNASPSQGNITAPTQRIWKAANASTSQHSETGHIGGWGRSPDLGVGWKRVSDASAVTEIHLRRLDSSDTLHRRVVAVLTVDATPEEASCRPAPACDAWFHHWADHLWCFVSSLG